MINPIGPGRFFDACVTGGGVFFDPPLKMDFLQKKCAIFCPGIKFDKILAIFCSLLQIFSSILTILAFLTLKWPKITIFMKIGLEICYVPQKKAKII